MAKWFRRDLREFLATKVVQVWHQDSPGMRVYVRRGWLKRLFFNRQFSMVGEHHLSPPEMIDTKLQAMRLAMTFHELYERSAPSHGYTTRTDTREFDPESPNGRLMTQVCMDLITGAYTLGDEDAARRKFEALFA